MTAPIDNQGPNWTPPVDSTSTEQTTGAVVGEHGVATTSSDTTVTSTATTVSTTAGTAISETVTTPSATTTTITSNISTTGGAEATATASRTTRAAASSLDEIKFSPETDDASSVGSSELENDLESIDDGDFDDISDIASDISDVGSESSLDSLGSIDENVDTSDLPQPLPSYDPTSRGSIIEFLKNPSVLKNMKEKGGNYVFIDEARSSFIFIPKGDYSKACSIAVCNGKTKEGLNPAQLEMAVAKFAAYNDEMENDWESRVQPTLQLRSGLGVETPIKKDCLVLNLKYKTAVGYGQLNARESGRHSPSAWRRGTEVKVSKGIWGDVGGLNPIDLSGQQNQLSEVNFDTETTPAPSPTPPSTPTINVNVNVGGTTVTVGGVSTTSTPEPPAEDPAPLAEPEGLDDGASLAGSDVGSVEEFETTTEEPPATSDEVEAGNDQNDLRGRLLGHIPGDIRQLRDAMHAQLGGFTGALRNHLNTVFDPSADQTGGSYFTPHSDGVTVGEIINGRRNARTQTDGGVNTDPWWKKPPDGGGDSGSGGAGAAAAAKQRVSVPETEVRTSEDNMLRELRQHLDDTFASGKKPEPKSGGLSNLIRGFEQRTGSSDLVIVQKRTFLKGTETEVKSLKSSDLIKAAANVTSALSGVVGAISSAPAALSPATSVTSPSPVSETATSTPVEGSPSTSSDLTSSSSTKDSLEGAARQTAAALSQVVGTVEQTASSPIGRLNLDTSPSPMRGPLHGAARALTSALTVMSGSVTEALASADDSPTSSGVSSLLLQSDIQDKTNLT